jgi:hypothetical protein
MHWQGSMLKKKSQNPKEFGGEETCVLFGKRREKRETNRPK